MSCSITVQKVIEFLDFSCLGLLIAMLWTNKYILVYMPYAHGDDDQNNEILAAYGLSENSQN